MPTVRSGQVPGVKVCQAQPSCYHALNFLDTPSGIFRLYVKDALECPIGGVSGDPPSQSLLERRLAL